MFPCMERGELKMKIRMALSLLLVLSIWGGAASAHHSFAMFDATQTKTLVGTVKQVQWTNPHIWIQVLVPDAKAGAAAEWSIEGGSPNGLTRQGWRRTSIKEGDAIEITIHPLKDGTNGGSMPMRANSAHAVCGARPG